jgi:hypothetical protein
MLELRLKTHVRGQHNPCEGRVEGFQLFHDVIEDGFASDGQQRLRRIQRKRQKPFSISTSEHNCIHYAFTVFLAVASDFLAS